MLADEPSAFNPKALELVVSIDGSFMDGPVQLKTTDVVDAVIAAYLLVKPNESSVKDGVILSHGFDVADLNVLALGGQNGVTWWRVLRQYVRSGELGLESLSECTNALVFEAAIDEQAISQEERKSLAVEANAKVLGFGSQLRQDVVVKTCLHPQDV